MAELTAFLSPNGQSTSQGDGPATRLKVATVEGLATLTRSEAGAPWTLAGRSLVDRHIGSLLFEPMSGKLFAGAHDDGGLWVSDDGLGNDWRPLTNGLDRPHIYTLAARRVGDQVTLFLGTAPAALYRSNDLGESWLEIKSFLDVPDTDKWTFPPPPHIPHVKHIVFHPDEDETIFVCVEQGALLISHDDGETWIEKSSYSKAGEIAYRDLHRLLIHPQKADQLYLASGEGLYRSDDGGDAWEQLTRRGDKLGYPDFLYHDPRDDGVLYMGGSYRNPGYWKQVGQADSSVLRSTDRGETWEPLDQGLPDPVIGAFEAMALHSWNTNQSRGMMLVLGTATGELYTSEVNGDDPPSGWTCIARGIAPVSKDDHHFQFMKTEKGKLTGENRS